jgi:opacity protein-like surface antigen
MKRKLFSIIAILAMATSATFAQDTGRTDGPEESEYGKGGNPFGSTVGRTYLNATFGSGFFQGAGLTDDTGFIYGFDLGYEMDDWIGIQGGYSYLSDRDLSIYSVGTNFSYPWHPFVYNVSLGAGLYDPDIGDRSFGLAPGAGVDIILGESVRLGLNYRHDFIFTDTATTDMDRVYAGLKFFY